MAGGAAVGMRHKKFFAGEPNVKTVMKGGDMPVPLSVVPPSMGDAPAPSTYYYRSVDVNSLVISCKHGCALSNLHLLLLSSCLDRQAHHHHEVETIALVAIAAGLVICSVDVLLVCCYYHSREPIHHMEGDTFIHHASIFLLARTFETSVDFAVNIYLLSNHHLPAPQNPCMLISLQL